MYLGAGQMCQSAWAAVLAYKAFRGAAACPFFIYRNGHLLARLKFNQDIEKALQEIGLLYGI